MEKRKYIKWTTETIKDKIHDLVGDEYSLTSEYVRAKDKATIKHNACGHSYNVLLHNFLKGKRCPKCKKPPRQKTHEQYSKEVYDLVGDKYTVLGKYSKGNDSILIKHNRCGYEWNPIAQSILNGVRCPKCSGNIKNKTTEYFKSEVFNMVKGEYEVIGEYVNKDTKLKVKHNNCQNVFLITPDNLLRGRGCPKCNRPYYNMTTEVYKTRVKEELNDEFEILENYVKWESGILTRHKKCGYKWITPPVSLLGCKNGCPQCNESKGERFVRKYLEDSNIAYEAEYTFKECKYKNKLRFDFALFKNKKLVVLVEYQGQQHYKPVSFGGDKEQAKENLLMNKKRDNIKRNFCIENNIPLIEIPYTENNISKYLGNKLKAFSI